MTTSWAFKTKQNNHASLCFSVTSRHPLIMQFEKEPNEDRGMTSQPVVWTETDWQKEIQQTQKTEGKEDEKTTGGCARRTPHIPGPRLGINCRTRVSTLASTPLDSADLTVAVAKAATASLLRAPSSSNRCISPQPEGSSRKAAMASNERQTHAPRVVHWCQ